MDNGAPAWPRRAESRGGDGNDAGMEERGKVLWAHRRGSSLERTEGHARARERGKGSDTAARPRAPCACDGRCCGQAGRQNRRVRGGARRRSARGLRMECAAERNRREGKSSARLSIASRHRRTRQTAAETSSQGRQGDRDVGTPTFWSFARWPRRQQRQQGLAKADKSNQERSKSNGRGGWMGMDEETLQLQRNAGPRWERDNDQ